MKTNDKLFKTLKAGLFNEIILFDKEEGTNHKLVIDEYKFSCSTISLQDCCDDTEVYDWFLPHLFPISMLTKPIKLKGWFDEDEFIPLIKLAEHSFAWNEAEKDHYILGTQVTSGAGLGFWFDNNTFKVSDPYFQNSFSQIELFELLDKWHINWRELDEDQFINAAESKVYEP